jgi:hypothetical protein
MECSPLHLVSAAQDHSRSIRASPGKSRKWNVMSSSSPIHRKKSCSIFPSLAGMSLTKLSLGGNNDILYKLFPPRESLVNDI